MAETTSAAGGLTEAERETLDWAFANNRAVEWVERIIAARTEAADREAARVTAAVEALADEWERDRDTCIAWIEDPAMHVDLDHPRRLSDRADWLNRAAEALRAALSSAGTDALDRERAKAAAEALREAAAEAALRDLIPRRETVAHWLRGRAAAVPPEGGDQ